MSKYVKETFRMNRTRSNKEILDKFLAKSKIKEPIDDVTPQEVSSCSYAIVRNIPKELHSKDLRKFFGKFIDAEKFNCFHYRHRPELQAEKTGDEASQKDTCCCMVSFKTKEDREEFIEEFHKRNWQNPAGSEIAKRCFIDRLKVQEPQEAGSSNSLSEADLKEMIELKPPAAMPNGNIGTPSQYFLEQIRLCRLPTSIITKLGIQTQKRKKKFGEMPFTYEDSAPRREDSKIETVEDVADEPEDPTERVRKNQNPEDNDDGKDDDDDQCEEWERHEALHEDVTEQDRTKPKKYEEEMEVTWEKGGPGLVWYTDKNYWDEKEKGTDCDWAWADDWDVDYSVYYEGKSAGDMDAKAAIEMKNDELLRAGKLEQTVFTRKKAAFSSMGTRRKRRHSDGDCSEEQRAVENLHKGVGGTMLERMGWKPGAGLGKKEQGRVVPVAVYVEEEGQSSREKAGFGYRGEKMSRIVEKRPVRHAIASVFDRTTDADDNLDKETGDTTTSEILFRRAEVTKMKYS